MKTYQNCQDLKFAPGLVLGFLTKDATACTETRYALYANGRVLQSEPVSAFGYGSTSFNLKGRKWTAVETVPADAQFIGNYPPPAMLDHYGEPMPNRIKW